MASQKSILMCDSTEANGPAEHVMDYVISYTLRLAQGICPNSTPILYIYVRHIIKELFELDDYLFVVKEVKTYKQEKNIDLIVKMKMRRGGKEEEHALLIENKHATNLQEGQLMNYKKSFEENYKGSLLHYALISSYSQEEMDEKSKNQIQEAGFRCFSIDDLLPRYMRIPDGVDYHNIDSENLIFNEFWLREWPCTID